MPTQSQRIVVITGPTATGKTRVGIELAQRFGGELVGADSVQVYRGFDIGSSKPTPAELGGRAHHLIDIAEPEEQLDAADYAARADRAIADIAARGGVPIVVGGTGLWLRALLRGLVDVPAVDAALRAKLEHDFDVLGALTMHARLAEVDPDSAARIHCNDKLRVVRALEVHAQTGRPLGALRASHALGAQRYNAHVMFLDVPQAHHQARVAARVRDMFDMGLREEVKQLLAKHGPDVRPLRSVGYLETAQHLAGQMSLEDTQKQIQRSTLVYARRQRTWWKNDTTVSARLTPEAATSTQSLAILSRHLERA